MGVVLYRLAERIGKPGHTPVVHPEREVGPLDVARADLRFQWIANDSLGFASRAFCRAVSLLAFGVGSKDLDNLPVIDVLTERELDRVLVGAVPVCAELHALVEPRG